MSRIRILFLVWFYLMQIFISTIGAEEINSPLKLKDALSLAYQQNPRMLAARKSIEASEGELLTTRTWNNPDVEMEIGGLKKDSDGERSANLDKIAFKQSFDPLGVRPLKTKIAKNSVRIQEEILKIVWADVYVSVRETFAKVLLDQKNLDLQQANLNTVRQFFSDVQIKFEGGQTLKNNLQRARIELLKAESRHLQAEKDLKTGQARLNLLLGREIHSSLSVKDNLKEDHLKSTLAQLTGQALQQRPDIKSAQLELDSRNNQVVKQQLSRLPSYSLGFEKSNEDGKEDYAALIELSIPLWNLNQGEVKKAKAEREAQKVELNSVKQEAAFQVYEAFLTAELSSKQFDLFKKSLEESNELFRLAGLRFREGEIDFINYLDQVQSVMETRVNYYQGLFQLNQSLSELEKAVYGSLRGEEDFFDEKD